VIRPLRVVTLDLSIRATGLAVTHDQVGEPRLACRTITPRKRNSRTRIDHERLHETFQAIAAAALCKPDLVVIEEPLSLDTGDTSIRLAELHGPIKHWFWARGIPYVDMHLSHVKQYATGNGGADKPTVLASVIATYGRLLHVHTYDEADAVSMLAAALDHYGQPLVEVGQERRKALAKQNWPDLTEGTR
jgi:crossover junction endodeoxyribonuclease RuvC